MRYRSSAPFVLVFALVSLSCATEPSVWARARLVESRADLVGGPRALGEVGDYRLENDRIRVIVQGPTHSRTLGIYGGGLIDVDLVRPRGDGLGDSSGGVGLDALGEIFPTFLLQAVDVQTVEVRADGSNGEAAQVAAVGTAGDFVELAGVLNRVLLGSHADYREPLSEQRLRYEIIYTLRPGARNVELTLRVTNISGAAMSFPTDDAARLAELVGFEGTDLPVPIGDIAAFSASSQAFVPGIGFDLRFGIEDAALTPRELPALPGVAAPWVATRGDGVSYGLVAAPSERNYVWRNRDQYGDDGPVDQTSVFVPFAAGGFVSIFYEVAPPTLAPSASFEATRYFVVGSGDVGSVLDEINRIKGVPTGRLGGRVFDQLTGSAATDAQVIVYRRLADGRRVIFSQYDVYDHGSFGGTLEPGDYSARVTGTGRPLGDFVDFTILGGRTTELDLVARSPARLVVHVHDDRGLPLPARVTVVGTYDASRVGMRPRDFLYDLSVGERPRVQDLVPDHPTDDFTRRYIENEGYTRNGAVELLVRPGIYEVHSSRGPEYDTDVNLVELVPGRTVTLGHTLRRVVDTPGFIAADMHLHSANSHDSAMDLGRRVRSVAAEGVEWAVSSDHNYITDFGPAIAEAGLADFMTSSIGLEVTTIESGHFNGYPVRYDLGSVSRGAIAWSDRPPAEIFDRLRGIGRYGRDETLIQVNHPRAPVLGYFGQYKRDTFSMEQLPIGVSDFFLSPSGPAFLDAGGQSTFSLDFDLLELVNGKRFRDVHHYRTPEDLPPDAPPGLPPPGTIVTDEEGQAVFPGAVDDWYNLLNAGYRFVAVGTSDSHNPNSEAGFFRTMVHTGADDVRDIDELDLVRGLRSGRAIATNGPFVEMWVDDPERGAMGRTLATSTPRSVRVTVRISAAPWVGVGRLNLVRNGQILEVERLDESRDYAADPFEVSFDVALAEDERGQPIDSWFVAEVIGYRSMFPIVRPFEVSPFQITEAVNTLAGGMDVLGPGLGSATPSENLPHTAYAITNPVWVTDGEHPFEAPGPVPPEVQAAPENDPGFPRGPKPPQSALSTTSGEGAPLTPWLFGRDPGVRHDLGAIMRRVSHAHAP